MKYYVASRISENIHKTPEGFLLCLDVPIARIGQMSYLEGETPIEAGDDGEVLIDREENEVFDPKTIASFEGKPVTIGHPTDHVNPGNWSQLAKGVLKNVRRGTGENKTDLLADLLLMDGVAINLVEMGLREVSCGYAADYEQTGTGRGKQLNIIGNHLALVDEGRAGSGYAIKDHKGKRIQGMHPKLKEQIGKLTQIITDAQGAISALVKDAAPDDKEDKSEKPGKKDKADDASTYDDLVKMVGDLGTKMDVMMKGKDKITNATGAEPATFTAEDDETGIAGSTLEDRLNQLEAAVAKLLEQGAQGSNAEMIDDEDPEEGGDPEETEDEEISEGQLVGDSVSRAEILAPGLKATGKYAKIKTLKAAYATEDGKKAIHSLTGGKPPNLKNPLSVQMLFIGASELLKKERKIGLAGARAGTRTTEDSMTKDATAPGPAPTAEELNKKYAEYYAKRA